MNITYQSYSIRLWWGHKTALRLECNSNINGEGNDIFKVGIVTVTAEVNVTQCILLSNRILLYVQEVVTLQKNYLIIFASENEVYNIYQLFRYFRLNIIRLQSKIILGHMNSIG